MGITIGDNVVHNYYDWQGIMKVKAINFGTVTVENDKGYQLYYSISDLTKCTEDRNLAYESRVKENNLYCNCSYSDAKIVESSIQVQGTVDKKDIFKYCRTCKKEKK